MKDKLRKYNNGIYVLYDCDGDIIASSDLKTSTSKKLSVKNCQAIENGYDLEDLAYDFSWNYQSDPNYGDTTNIFKAGFQKALEIIGDKKFSINEVVELCKILISNPFERSGKTYQELTDSYVQSLQQTEWDVELVMVPALSNNGNVYYGDIPKLDADGCLILKRI